MRKKWKIAIIKEYTEKEPLILYGETSDMFTEDYCKELLKHNKIRNVGDFIVIQIINDFAYIKTYLNGIDEKDSSNYRIIAVYSVNVFLKALSRLVGKEVQGDMEVVRDA